MSYESHELWKYYGCKIPTHPTKTIKLTLKDRFLRACKEKNIKNFIKTFKIKTVEVPLYVYFTSPIA